MTKEREALKVREEEAWREIHVQSARNQRLVEDLDKQTSPITRMVVKQRDAADAALSRMREHTVAMVAIADADAAGRFVHPEYRKNVTERARAALADGQTPPACTCGVAGGYLDFHIPECPAFPRAPAQTPASGEGQRVQPCAECGKSTTLTVCDACWKDSDMWLHIVCQHWFLTLTLVWLGVLPSCLALAAVVRALRGGPLINIDRRTMRRSPALATPNPAPGGGAP